jgi:hypothetical protein
MLLYFGSWCSPHSAAPSPPLSLKEEMPQYIVYRFDPHLLEQVKYCSFSFIKLFILPAFLKLLSRQAANRI